MNTLLHYIESNGMKMRKLKAYLRPSLTTFCRNLFERTDEKRRRIKADDSFQFSAQFKLTALLRRNIRFNISKGNEFEKSWPEKSLQRSESHLFWHEHGKGNKPQAAQAIEFWIRRPQSSCASKNCVGVLYNTSVSEQENISQAICYCLPPPQFLQVVQVFQSRKYCLTDRQKTLSQILESTIAFVRFRYEAFLKFCLMNLFFELVVACSFFFRVARVIKSTSRRKPSAECHITNDLLTELARAVLPQSRANIPQNGLALG